jgi:hypothetical protein
MAVDNINHVTEATQRFSSNKNPGVGAGGVVVTEVRRRATHRILADHMLQWDALGRSRQRSKACEAELQSNHLLARSSPPNSLAAAHDRSMSAVAGIVALSCEFLPTTR